MVLQVQSVKCVAPETVVLGLPVVRKQEDCGKLLALRHAWVSYCLVDFSRNA